MGWGLGFDSRWDRDIGYGVPAYCDHPMCRARINRGLSYVCGSDPYGGDRGCGLYFCEEHRQWVRPRGEDRSVEVCARCAAYRPTPYRPSPEHPEWMTHVLTDASWALWRSEHPAKAQQFEAALAQARSHVE
jgi:hypothetical protein